MAPSLALALAGFAALALPAAANDILHMDKTAAREMYSMYSSRSPIDRRLADPSEDDAALRAELAALGLPELCAEGKLRDVGTEDAREIGCCHPDCYMCMARGCGTLNADGASPAEDASILFPSVAPVCCYSFFDWRVEEDRGMSSRECSDAADVGCMLPESYNSPERTNVVAELNAEVVGVVTADNFCTACLEAALVQSVPSISSASEVSVSSVAEQGGRRRLQTGARNLMVTVVVQKVVGAGEDGASAGSAVEDDLIELRGDSDRLAELGDFFADAVNADDTIPDGEEFPLKNDLTKTSFAGIMGISLGVGSLSEPTDAPTTAVENPNFDASSKSSDKASNPLDVTGPFSGFLVAFILVLLLIAAMWVRRSRDRKQNAAALLDLKIGPDAALRDVLAEDADSVYLPPTLPGRSSRGLGSSASGSQAGSAYSGHQPRAWETRSRGGFEASETSSFHGSVGHRSMRSASSVSSSDGNRAARAQSNAPTRVVQNELNMLTRPRGDLAQADVEAGDDLQSTFSEER